MRPPNIGHGLSAGAYCDRPRGSGQNLRGIHRNDDWRLLGAHRHIDSVGDSFAEVGHGLRFLGFHIATIVVQRCDVFVNAIIPSDQLAVSLVLQICITLGHVDICQGNKAFDGFSTPGSGGEGLFGYRLDILKPRSGASALIDVFVFIDRHGLPPCSIG